MRPEASGDLSGQLQPMNPDDQELMAERSHEVRATLGTRALSRPGARYPPVTAWVTGRLRRPFDPKKLYVVHRTEALRNSLSAIDAHGRPQLPDWRLTQTVVRDKVIRARNRLSG
jgi:hypothetical protein